MLSSADVAGVANTFLYVRFGTAFTGCLSEYSPLDRVQEQRHHRGEETTMTARTVRRAGEAWGKQCRLPHIRGRLE